MTKRHSVGGARTEPTTKSDPGCSFTRPETPVDRDGVVYVLTGERGSGKSTVCARVAREAALRGLAVAGILTERQDDADLGSARRVVDLRSGETRPFGSQDRECAHDRPEGTGRVAGVTASDPLTPGWQFDDGVFVWANAVLERSTPCDLLVVDEIGPLELRGGRGWVKALEALDSAGYRAALVVCRPGLMPELREKLRMDVSAVFEVTQESRDALPTAITEKLREALGRL